MVFLNKFPFSSIFPGGELNQINQEKHNTTLIPYPSQLLEMNQNIWNWEIKMLYNRMAKSESCIRIWRSYLSWLNLNSEQWTPNFNQLPKKRSKKSLFLLETWPDKAESICIEPYEQQNFFCSSHKNQNYSYDKTSQNCEPALTSQFGPLYSLL